MSDFTIEANHRDEVESLLETIEHEGWDVKKYDVDNSGASLRVKIRVSKC